MMSSVHALWWFESADQRAELRHRAHEDPRVVAAGEGRHAHLHLQVDRGVGRRSPALLLVGSEEQRHPPGLPAEPADVPLQVLPSEVASALLTVLELLQVQPVRPAASSSFHWLLHWCLQPCGRSLSSIKEVNARWRGCEFMVSETRWRLSDSDVAEMPVCWQKEKKSSSRRPDSNASAWSRDGAFRDVQERRASAEGTTTERGDLFFIRWSVTVLQPPV